MNILLLGSGGREHALAYHLAQSPQLTQLYIAPGNAGTKSVGVNVPLKVTDFEGIKDFVLTHQVKMVVVGPEDPLVAGIHDFFAEDDQLGDVMVIGPKREGAILEGSKAFSKAFMLRHNIPTASYLEVTQQNLETGIEHIGSHATPVVLKADGLAAGKGVLICDSEEEAMAELKNMLGGKFGDAGATVVIEEFLDGIEFSVFAITDGEDYHLLPTAKDYKRIGEGDKGLNTGGMGAISPVPFVDRELMDRVVKGVIEPTFAGLKKEGRAYQGFLYFGLIMVAGDPYVIEYNCRMGDPETEAVLPLIETDFVELFKAVGESRLSEVEWKIKDEVAATIILASGGYPEQYEKGKVITDLGGESESLVFHAGTTLNDKQELLTNGGRVLAITSLASSMKQALKKSYKVAEQIDFEGKYYRRDIGFDLK